MQIISSDFLKKKKKEGIYSYNTLEYFKLKL